MYMYIHVHDVTGDVERKKERKTPCTCTHYLTNTGFSLGPSSSSESVYSS